MDGLRISPDFTLPLDLVVQQAAILARTGAGKTNAATVIAEELLAAGQQVVIIDPPGAWWGITASADGGPGGYAVVVLGGEHGDLALPPAGGALVADIVVDQGISAILDLSDLSNAQISAFVLAFASRLYERKARARSPLLLVIEEADEVAPQRAMPDQTRMLGAIERVVKRGRMRGIGTLMISQRSASLNKNVLSQAELLIAMQTTAPQDIKAIDAWIEHHGDQERRVQLVSEIATLGKGEAFVWSPGWLHAFQKIRFRLRHTFDSSATPKPGETLIEPSARAAVDLDVIRAALATPETSTPPVATRDQKRAEGERTRLLAEQEQRITELERRLRERPAPAVEHIEVPVLVPADVERLTVALDDLRAVAMRIIDAADGIRTALVRARPGTAVESEPATAPDRWTQIKQRNAARSEGAPARSAIQRPVAIVPSRVSAPRQRLLDVLASYEALGVRKLDRRTLAASTGVSPRSSAYEANLRGLRADGLVEYPRDGHVALMQAGRALASATTPPTLSDLHMGWMRLLTKPRAVLLTILIGQYPAATSRETLAGLAGVSPRSSAFEGNVRHLRALGLVTYPADNHVAATSLLFPEGLR